MGASSLCRISSTWRLPIKKIYYITFLQKAFFHIQFSIQQKKRNFAKAVGKLFALKVNDK
jgi:hypothetical protein